jgi:hypothetical protein
MIFLFLSIVFSHFINFIHFYEQFFLGSDQFMLARIHFFSREYDMTFLDKLDV